MLKANLSEIVDVSHECRRLKNLGYEDQPMEFYNGEKLSLTVKSIHKQANFTISNEPNIGYVKYREFVKFNKTENASPLISSNHT